ncbi:MAG: hypothetical protein OXF21_01365, partial [bacterium]|nr:hypothetical protein [bacterium]
DDAAVTVVCASKGYPRTPTVGDVISGIEAANHQDGVKVFCAGVASQPAKSSVGTKSPVGRSKSLVTAGGRVLSVTGQGPSLEVARTRAYQGVTQIEWQGCYFRRDIAKVATAVATDAPVVVSSSEAHSEREKI